MFRILLLLLFFSSVGLGQAPSLLENNMDVIVFSEKEGQYQMTKINFDTTQVLVLDSLELNLLLQFKKGVREKNDSLDLYEPYLLTLRKLEPLQKHLIIVTDGVFRDFPFPAMTKKKPLGHEDMTQHDYIINEHTITYQTSISKWEEMTNHAVSNEETVVLVKDKKDVAFELLKEAKYIRDDFGGRLITYEDSDWLTVVHSARLLHLNAEAHFDRSIILKGKEVESAAELISLSLMDEALRDDAIVNRISQSMAKSILYSAWPVKESSRRFILNEFYKNLFDGERKNDAIQMAIKRYLKKTSDVNMAHPYYWAGWRFYGDFKSVNNTVNPLLYLVIIILFIFFYYLIKRAKVKMY